MRLWHDVCEIKGNVHLRIKQKRKISYFPAFEKIYYNDKKVKNQIAENR